jgi:hypothetical protein
MKMTLGRILLAALCWGVTSPDAFACVCVGSLEPPSTVMLAEQAQRELDESLAVFVGVPIALNTLTVRLRVESVWTGGLGRELGSAQCRDDRDTDGDANPHVAHRGTERLRGR